MPEILINHRTPPFLVKNQTTRLVSMHDYSQLEIALPILWLWGVDDIINWVDYLYKEAEEICNFVYFLSRLFNIRGIKQTLQQTLLDWLMRLSLDKNIELYQNTYFMAYEATLPLVQISVY